jgi:hypothetical protein
MSPAQAWLIVGGIFNLFFSTLAGYALYWLRLQHVEDPVPRYALIAHTSSITDGLLLLGLSVAIEHTGFIPGINLGLAIAVLLATEFTNVRNLVNWARNRRDGFAELSPTQQRLRGLSNMINLVVIAAILYGVARTALGI